LIRENKERAANEILAMVTSDGIKLTVTRNEYLAYANYLLSQYSQYGQTPDLKSFMPEILDYMINQKYLIIKSMVYLKSLPHRQDIMAGNDSDIDINSPEGVLTYAERYKAIKEVNETFEKEIENYIKEYEEEQKNIEINRAKETLSIRFKEGYSVKEIRIAQGSFKQEYLKDEKLDETKVKLEVVIEKKGVEDQIITMPVNSTMYDKEATFSTELSSEEQSQKVVTKNVILVYEEPFTDENGETDYREHKSQPFEYRVVVPRGTEKEEDEVDEEEGDVPDRYKAKDQISEENKAEYFNYNVSTTDAIKEAYRRFRQAKKDMLINFETQGLQYYYRNQYETAVIAAAQHEIKRSADLSQVTDEYIEQEYRILAQRQKEEYDILSTDKEKVNKFVKSLSDGSMNLEKVYYIPLQALQNEGYDIKEFFAITHILFKFDDTQKAFIDKEKGNRDKDELKDLRWKVAQNTKTSRSNPNYDPEYDCPLHKHNEGECIYEGEGLCPSLAFDPDHLEEELFGDDGIYQTISQALSQIEDDRERLELFKDYMVLYNDDGGAMSSHTGYLITPEGIPHSYDGDDFPGLAWKLFEKNPKIGSAFVVEDDKTYLGYAFTSYGIHLMMISFIPFKDEGSIDENGFLKIDTALDLKGTTHKELLRKQFEDRLKSDAYSAFTKENTPKDENFSIDNKKFNKLLKELNLK
jgi:hypothetical protein